MECCENKSEFFSTPLEAYKNGPREKLLYITCVSIDPKSPDYLAVVDADPISPTYSKVIYRLFMPNIGDELHHFGWNACASCVGSNHMSRSHLIFPTLHSSRVYVVNVKDDPKKPFLEKTIELENHGHTFPHTAHCLSTGEIMISCLGDKNGNAKGTFAVIDGKSLDYKGNWTKEDTKFGYDFWYQPRLDVMISTEWGCPNHIKKGLNVEDVINGHYGTHLHVWKWSTREYVQSIDLFVDGCMPLEIRFLHNPDSDHGYVACGLGSSLFHFYKNDAGKWTADRVVKADSLQVEGWLLPEMPAVFTDFLISMDDRFIYLAAWVHGYIQQYDITDRFHPKLVGQVYIAGSLVNSGSVKVKDANFVQPDPLIVKGRKINGGAQMLQLSLDGKRLYVSTSLYSSWDYQFYPDLKKGAALLMLDVDTEKGGMKVNENFLVDFGDEPNGPALAHETRYPGGDCTSDIWI
jgi:selenium-binding protein 1